MRRPPWNNPLHLLPHLVGLTRHPVPDLTGTRLDVLGGLGRGAGGLGGGRPDVGGGGAESGRGGARDGVADDLGAVLADQGAQVVELGALRDCVLLVPNGQVSGLRRFDAPGMLFLSQNSFSWDSLHESISLSVTEA